MRIGITYDLRADYLADGYSLEATAEFDSPATIEAIVAALQHQGAAVDRIGSIKRLAARLVAGERWDLVFNIAEGLHGTAREAQVPSLLDAYEIPYTFSDSLVLALTLHKGITKQLIWDCGISTAPFLVAETEADLAGLHLSYPLFAKPVAEGSGKGISKASRVETGATLVALCHDLWQRFRQPVLIETYLTGREFTVGIVGSGPAAEAIATMEVLFGANAELDAYTFSTKETYEDRVIYRLVDDEEARGASAIALAAWRAIGCRDGGRIDIRSDARGRPQFIEVNPLPGLHPERSDLVIMSKLAGWTYDSLIGQIVASALARHNLSRLDWTVESRHATHPD